MQNNLEEKQKRLIEENINISDENPIAELLRYAFAIFLIIVFIYIFADLFSKICIDFMPFETQQKIENILSKTSNHSAKDQIHSFDNIVNRIVSYDSKLYKRKNFSIYKNSSGEINAYVIPDGSIFLTEGLLKNIKDDEMMTFVLAHEIGHYVHRDHLRSLGRDVIALIFSCILSSGTGNTSNITSNIDNIVKISYSKNQETNADKYAAIVTKKIYGNTNGAVEFFKLIEQKSKYPEFLEYMSSHPSVKSRIKMVKKYN